jgi:mannose-1-phosphate guanylyltransferase
MTSAKSQAYGSNLVLKGSKWCIFSGDVNHDGLVDLSDLIIVDNGNLNYASGYIAADINGDGIVDLSDLIIVDNNNSIYVSKSAP